MAEEASAFAVGPAVLDRELPHLEVLQDLAHQDILPLALRQPREIPVKRSGHLVPVPLVLAGLLQDLPADRLPPVGAADLQHPAAVRDARRVHSRAHPHRQLRRQEVRRTPAVAFVGAGGVAARHRDQVGAARPVEPGSPGCPGNPAFLAQALVVPLGRMEAEGEKLLVVGRQGGILDVAGGEVHLRLAQVDVVRERADHRIGDPGRDVVEQAPPGRHGRRRRPARDVAIGGGVRPGVHFGLGLSGDRGRLEADLRRIDGVHRDHAEDQHQNHLQDRLEIGHRGLVTFSALLSHRPGGYAHQGPGERQQDQAGLRQGVVDHAEQLPGDQGGVELEIGEDVHRGPQKTNSRWTATSSTTTAVPIRIRRVRRSVAPRSPACSGMIQTAKP